MNSEKLLTASFEECMEEKHKIYKEYTLKKRDAIRNLITERDKKLILVDARIKVINMNGIKKRMNKFSPKK